MAKSMQRRIELLSKVSALVGTVDLNELLEAIAQLSIPELADWSSVDIHDAALRRVYVAHRDPAKSAVAERLQQYGPWRGRPGWSDLAAGRSLFFPEVTEEILQQHSQSPEQLAVLRELGLCSALAVPLRLGGETIAVMSFATTKTTGRRYTRDDLALAEELARRAVALLERARLYADLKTSEARFRVAVATARVALFEQDRQLRYRWYHNVGLYREAIGKTHEELFPPELAAQLTAVKQRVLDSGAPASAEIRLVVDGEPRVMRMWVEPMRDDLGAVVGVIGASTDITEEKRAQDDLSRKLAFRDQLMAILGHDLRNPLSAVLASAGLLRQRADLPASARDQAERIERAARRMNEMIRTLLDLTQLRFHGALPVSPAPADLGEIASAIVDELRTAEPNRKIELDVHGDARGSWDPARLGEVVSNLVANALVHGDDVEPVRVTIDVGGDDVWLRVHNGGKAIAPEVRAVLFEPFRRGDGAPRGKSLGLGLYIVRQIVLAHDGTVRVDSTDRDGTTVTVRLPRAVHAGHTLAAL